MSPSGTLARPGVTYRVPWATNVPSRFLTAKEKPFVRLDGMSVVSRKTVKSRQEIRRSKKYIYGKYAKNARLERNGR